MEYPWYTKLIIGTAVVLLLSSPSASSWNFKGIAWSPENVALIAIGMMLAVLIDYTRLVVVELRHLNQRGKS